MFSTDHFCLLFLFFFFTDTATTEIYTLSLHDALPISAHPQGQLGTVHMAPWHVGGRVLLLGAMCTVRSEEHTSELQSLTNLVCRLLLEKKKKKLKQKKSYYEIRIIIHQRHT